MTLMYIMYMVVIYKAVNWVIFAVPLILPNYEINAAVLRVNLGLFSPQLYMAV